MEKKQPAPDTSLKAIVLEELRERPLLFVSFILFACLVSLLMPYAERHDPDLETGHAAQNASMLPAGPVETQEDADHRSALMVPDVGIAGYSMVGQWAGFNVSACGTNMSHVGKIHQR